MNVGVLVVFNRAAKSQSMLSAITSEENVVVHLAEHVFEDAIAVVVVNVSIDGHVASIWNGVASVADKFSLRHLVLDVG